MKVLNITYETAVIEDGKKAYGEACMDVPMMDELADRLMNNIPCGIAVSRIENILRSVELLRGRHYVKGSIKDYREAK